MEKMGDQKTPTQGVHIFGEGPKKDARKILVVDDEPDTRMFYEEVLIDAGFDVHCESDGMRALQYASVHRVDLVVTDARMPTLDGLSMLPFFENAQVRVPVIVVSAYPEYNSDVLKKYSAVKAFFQKPLDADQLILKIRQCLFMV